MLSKIFPRNEHLIDRAIRVVLGLAILSLVFVGPQTLWGLLGLVPLVTGLVGSCPVYTLLGLSTCPVERAPRPAQRPSTSGI
jgi:fatty acid desaturase